MCERIPADCLPEPSGDLRPEVRPDAASHESPDAAWVIPQADVWPLDRRMVLAGMGSLLLTACAPARRSRSRTSAAGAARPPSRPRRPAPPAYRVLRRTAWGAEALKPNHDPMDQVTRVTLHHTAEVAGMGTRTDAELVKGIQNFHRNTRGWADIGYHWIIGLDGNVYEGRALHVQGAHAGGGNNKHNLGISVIGDFTNGLPASKQLRTTALFLEASLRHYKVPTSELRGHRDFKATECPGSALYAWLESFKRSRAS